MTFEEAKKILEKEGFYVEKATRPCAISESFTEYEDPSICKAMQVVSSAGYFVCMEMSCFDERKARLKKEFEEHANAPVSGKEKAKKGNPALKEAASQFNDALLDEQAKEIECLRDKCKKLVDILDSVRNKLRKLKAENSRIKNSDLNLEGLINATRELKEKNKEIAELTKENEDLKSWRENLNREISLNTVSFINETKRLGKEISKLNSIIHDKNAVLADVAEELRLTKIREKNLAELGLKYVGENEKLKKKLAEKIVDKIDAQALKSAESALAYKEKVIAEKDEVIADLGKELAAQKDLVDDISLKYDGAKHNLKLRMDECEKLKEKLEEANNRIIAIRNASKGYCEYGIAAEKMIQKMADVIVYDKPVFSKEFEEYRRWANGYRYNPQLYDFIEEEKKRFSPVKDTHPTEDNPEEVKMNEILEHVRKVLEEGGTVYTSYDKAEEGGDQSATIVQHRKSIVDLFKEIKRLWQE